jgi:hypothetical protein
LLCLLWVIAWTFFCGDTGLTAKDAAVIRKRRNGLQVQVYAGRDPLTGRKQWVSRQVPGQTKRSYREAKKIERSSWSRWTVANTAGARLGPSAS